MTYFEGKATSDGKILTMMFAFHLYNLNLITHSAYAGTHRIIWLAS